MRNRQLLHEIDVRRIKLRNNSHKGLKVHIFFLRGR